MSAPIGIVAPVNEKPITVVPEVVTLNPLLAALPPDAPVIFIPVKLN